MKYVQFPKFSVPASANTWVSQVIYTNKTNKFIVIMGFQFLNAYLPNNEPTQPYEMAQGLIITDPNGNNIDNLEYSDIKVYNAQATIPVYNGTSIVNETATFPYAVNTNLDMKRFHLLPPQCSIEFVGYCSNAITFGGTGGWGFILEDEEIDIILKGKIQI